MGVPAAQPFPDLGWAAGGLHFGAGFKVSRILISMGGREDRSPVGIDMWEKMLRDEIKAVLLDQSRYSRYLLPRP